jgi:hypothetical protein
VDLNGKTVRQTGFGNRVYQIQGAGNFSIMDSVGTGSLIAATSDSSGKCKNGLVIHVNHDNAVVNVYSGTIDASEATAEFGACVYIYKGTMNIYGGTFKGGTVYGSGSTVLAVSVDSVLNMYDGTFIGGYHQNNGFSGSSVFGGTVMRVTGVANIYGGTFQGGRSDYIGGNLYVKTGGTMKMLGGTVIDGDAIGEGNGIYTEAGATLILGGDVQVTGNKGGNLYLDINATLKIDASGLNGAQIGISTNKSGDFVTGSFTAEDVACFTSDNSAKTVTLTDTGIALVG